MVTVLHSRVGESMLIRVTIPVSAKRGRRTIRVGAEGSVWSGSNVSEGEIGFVGRAVELTANKCGTELGLIA